MKPKLIDPSKLHGEKYYEKCCNGCELAKNFRYGSRFDPIVIGQTVRLNRNEHEQCASCYRILSDLRKGKPFYLV